MTEQKHTMSDLSALYVLVAPPLYLGTSATCWLIWSSFLKILQTVSVQVRSVPALQPVAPAVVAINLYMERIFGPAHKFTPTSTHVVLLAIVVALIVHLERLRAAVRRR